MGRLHYNTFAIITLLCGIWLSCRKEITLDDSDKNFPVELTATVEGDSIILNWDSKRVTQFQRVIVLRSNEPMPANISPQNPFNALMVFNSNDATVNRFTESLPVFFIKAYYKVFVQIDGRFIQSDNVSLQFSSFVDDGRPEAVFVHPDSNWVVVSLFSNNSSPQLALLDINQRKIRSRISINDIFDVQYSSATFMRYQNKEYLQVITSTQRYLRYELPQMTLVEEKPIPYPSWSILAQRENDLVFMTHYDYSNSVTVRKTGNILDAVRAFERPNNYYYVRKQYFLNAAERKILEVSPYDVLRFSVSATGLLIPGYSKSVGLPGYPPYTSQMPVAPNGEYFIPNLSGGLYNEELELVKTVPLDPNGGTVDFCFSADGNYIYALDNSFFPNFTPRIRKFSISNMQLVGEQVFTGLQAKRLILSANKKLVFLFTNGQEPAQFSYKIIEL